MDFYEKTNDVMKKIKNLYLKDNRPWIVGISGGKDSSCTAQMIYYMLLGLPEKKRFKEIHFVSVDTLVESPIIKKRLEYLIGQIKNSVVEDELPITVNLLKPKLDDTFWVNLIGRGYPSPNRWFRWCTDRLKIRPTNEYIFDQVKKNGEVIVVLGARKSESASRAQTMGKYEIKNFNLRKHGNISGAFVYTPIEDYSTEEVWSYLLQVPPPWGGTNKDLITFYRKADSECPMVLDKETPACGNSRFGCWTCTVVDRDRSLEGLIEDGEQWLQPLLDYRNWLKKIRNETSKREKISKSDRKKMMVAKKLGKEFEQSTHRGHKILGPFSFETRHEMLKRLLDIQNDLKKFKPDVELISTEEIGAIERLWIYEGDSSDAFRKIMDESIQFKRSIKTSPLKINVFNKTILDPILQSNNISESLFEKLYSVEKDLSSFSKKRSLEDRLEKVIDEHILAEELIEERQ